MHNKRSSLAQADFQVVAKGGKFTISNPNDNRPVCREVKGFNEDSATEVVGNLEHISRWKTALEWQNPDTSYV